MKKLRVRTAIILSIVLTLNTMTVFGEETESITEPVEISKEIISEEAETEEAETEEAAAEEIKTKEIVTKETETEETETEESEIEESSTRAKAETVEEEDTSEEAVLEETVTMEKELAKSSADDNKKENIVYEPINHTEKASVVKIQSKKKLHLYSGSVYPLSAKAYNTKSKIKWKSSDKSIVTVDDKGNIETKNPGTAKVYAYCEDAWSYVTVRVYKSNYRLSLSSKTLMKGTSFKLSVKGCSYADYSVDKTGSNGIVSITDAHGSGCTVNARKKGTQNVVVSIRNYKNKNYVTWRQVCKVTVSNKGIKEQVISVAEGKTRKIKLHNIRNDSKVRKIRWKSSDRKVAAVNSAGTVKGKSKGMAKITAVITYKSGKVEKYSIKVKVSTPKLNRKSIYMTTDSAPKTIKVWGINSYSTVKFRSTKSRVASVTGDGVVTPRSKGAAVIRVTVDGKVMKCKVVVSNPYLENDKVVLTPGRSAKIILKGTIKKSRVKYRSMNTDVAKVSSSGKVTALNYGRAVIIVNADGKKLRYLVKVVPRRKICIDAGHYGKYNRSPVVPEYYESDMVWKLSLMQKEILEDYGFEVILTRSNKDTDRGVWERGYAAKGCVCFISNHSNACGTESTDYPVVYRGYDNIGNCDELALKLANVIASTMGTVQAGMTAIRRGSSGEEYYGVLRGARAAGLSDYYILEHSFHTNARMARWLLNDANLRKLAEEECRVIAEHYGMSYGKAEDKSGMTRITGKAEVTAKQMAAYIKAKNGSVAQSVLDMIPLYLSEGKAENIRGDIAFAQSCLETGNFTFSGSAVKLSQNNFCGMGVTKNGERGNSFSTPQLGIRAQIQHLKAYANTAKLKQDCIDPRFNLVSRGCAPYVEYLGIQENPNGKGWAAGAGYGEKILKILDAIKGAGSSRAASGRQQAGFEQLYQAHI